jgi:5-hydroxyisourate hydrolase
MTTTTASTTTQRSPITTHVLDTSLGKPAVGVAVRLARLEGGAFVELAAGTTDADGRASQLLAPGSLTKGTYRISFDVGAYFAASGRASFYPHVDVVFVIESLDPHHGSPPHWHVPLLLNPFGYSTYRGS